MLTDKELNRLVGFDCPLPIGLYAAYWSLLLERKVTPEEAQDAIRRINAREPHTPGTTYSEITRNVW